MCFKAGQTRRPPDLCMGPDRHPHGFRNGKSKIPWMMMLWIIGTNEGSCPI